MSNQPNEIFKLSKTPFTVAYTGTAGSTTALTSKSGFCQIMTTTDAFVSVGATATSANGTYFTAKVPQKVSFAYGDIVSAIQVTTGGNLHVTELTK
jgi:hypothetical protein